jgi:threonine/homoserine/homoserine lactone efflux protein
MDVLVYLLQGAAFGFAAAVQPGPFQTYLIAHALRVGWRRALPAALAPLLSDGPIILLAVFVLSWIPPWVQRVLFVAGGLFAIYLAAGTWRARAASTVPTLEAPERGVLKATFTNLLNPGPWVFWTLVTGPILVSAWRQAPLQGLSFLLGFYVVLITTLAGIIILFGTARALGPRITRVLLGLSAVVLFAFGCYQIWRGLSGG